MRPKGQRVHLDRRVGNTSFTLAALIISTVYLLSFKQKLKRHASRSFICPPLPSLEVFHLFLLFSLRSIATLPAMFSIGSAIGPNGFGAGMRKHRFASYNYSVEPSKASTIIQYRTYRYNAFPDNYLHRLTDSSFLAGTSPGTNCFSRSLQHARHSDLLFQLGAHHSGMERDLQVRLSRCSAVTSGQFGSIHAASAS
jgi:hypothetical protein